MSAQRGTYEAPMGDDRPPRRNRGSDNDGKLDQLNGSNRTLALNDRDGGRDEFIAVNLAEIRNEVQCPICLGIIRKTRTVMECLHRFCRECIDKSMRLGNKECPTCRTHCASRRSLRDDLNFDALIEYLFPNIDQFEAEELTFHEEEKALNKQIQAAIAQTFLRQSEALGKKSLASKMAASAFARSPLGSYRNASLRGRRNYQTADLQGSDEDGNFNGKGKESISSDELIEKKIKRLKRSEATRFSLTFSVAANADTSGDEIDSEANKELVGASDGLVNSSEGLSWGKGGMRSQMRYGSGSGSGSGSNGKNPGNSHLSNSGDYARNLEDNSELNINVLLVSVDESRIPGPQYPYLSCPLNLTVKCLCQYVAVESALDADEVQMYLAKKLHSECNPSPSSIFPSEFSVLDPGEYKLQVLREEETLAGLELEAIHSSSHEDYLLLAFQIKK